MSLCTCGNEAEESGLRCARCAALQVLELQPTATASEIKAAYHLLVKVWHPDRFQNDAKLKQAADEKLKAINSAYLVLTSRSTSGPRTRKQKNTPPEPPAWRADSQPVSTPTSPAPRQSPRNSLRTWFTAFAAAGIVHRLILLALGLGAGGIFLKIVDSTLASDPDTARVYVEYRTSMMDQLNASKKRVWEPVEESLRRFRSQPASPVSTLPVPAVASADQVAQPSAASVTRLQRKTVALAKIRAFVTTGLTKDEVIAIAGTPTSASDDKLVFGSSEVSFKDGSVVGWKIDPASSLTVKLWPTSDVDRTLRFFSVDSTKDDVLVIQGTPTLLAQDKFGYGASEICFHNNRVVSWKNDPASVPLRAVSR